jgi:hypothetical protein
VTIGTGPALIIALLFVLPGSAYQIVRTRFRGPSAEEQDKTNQFMRALAASTVLVGVYVVVAAPRAIKITQGTNDDPYAGVKDNAREIGVWGLLLLVGVPAMVAWIECWLARRGTDHARYDPTPTSWQWGTERAFNRPGFVRVLTDGGTWVGGYFADGSHATSYPHPPALFIERGHVVTGDGVIGEAKTASRGVWVRCDNATAVEFLDGVVPERHSSKG